MNSGMVGFDFWDKKVTDWNNLKEMVIKTDWWNIYDNERNLGMREIFTKIAKAECG